MIWLIFSMVISLLITFRLYPIYVVVLEWDNDSTPFVFAMFCIISIIPYAGCIDGRVDFVKSYADALSDYNSYLKKCKIIITKSRYWWLREGIFISDDIMNLEELNLEI